MRELSIPDLKVNPEPIGPGLASYIHDKARRDGGVTYNLQAGKCPTTGYAVAISKRFERIISRPLLDLDLVEYARDHAQAITAANLVFQGAVCLGMWKDGNDWYLDLSLVVPSLDEALKLGRQAHQLAVYDLSEQKTVYIPHDDTQPKPLDDHPWA